MEISNHKHIFHQYLKSNSLLKLWNGPNNESKTVNYWVPYFFSRTLMLSSSLLVFLYIRVYLGVSTQWALLIAEFQSIFFNLFMFLVTFLFQIPPRWSWYWRKNFTRVTRIPGANSPAPSLISISYISSLEQSML